MSTRVGGTELPDLPEGWPVSWDTETSGLFPDGDPGTKTQPAAPKARVSVISIAYRDPQDGRMVSHAFPFDQGPRLGKQGRAVRDARTGRQSFSTLGIAEQAKILLKFNVWGGPDGEPILDDRGQPIWVWDELGVPDVEGRRPIPATPEMACPNLEADDYARLVEWMAGRDLLIAHNAKFDLHILAAGHNTGALDSPDDHYRAYNLAARNFGLPVAITGPVYGSLGAVQPHEFALGPGRNLDPQLVGGRGREIYCTMLTQGLIDPLESSSLKPTMSRLHGDDEAWQQYLMKEALRVQGVGLGKRYDLTPWFVIEGYAARDAEQALRLYEYQQECVRQGAVPPKFAELQRGEFDLMLSLFGMELRGMAYRVEDSFECSTHLRRKAEALAAQMPFDPSKINQVKKYFFGPPEDGGLGIEPTERTEKTQAPKLDEAETRRLVEMGIEWAAEYDEYSHILSAIAKWYDGWAIKTGFDGRLRTNFRQGRIESDRPDRKSGGAISGRLSVERFQVQAIPHNYQLPEGVPYAVRDLIVAKPGFKLMEMDLPQGEVRIATVLANCQAMWDIVDSGEDLHGATAFTIFGVRPGDPNFKELRGVAKRIVFGTLYGAGVRTLREQIRVFVGLDYSEAETRAIVNEFKNSFPEFAVMAQGCMYKADRGYGGPGYINLINGRRRWFGHAEHTHKAMNQAIQGGLAETGKRWVAEVDREMPGYMVAQIHDSLIGEFPDTDEGTALANRMAAIGTRVYEEDYSVRGRPMFFPMEPELFGSSG